MTKKDLSTFCSFVLGVVLAIGISVITVVGQGGTSTINGTVYGGVRASLSVNNSRA